MSLANPPLVIDSLDHYLARIKQFELLDRDEETALARRYRRDGDLEAAHRLICGNLRFVVKVANEYRGYGMKMLDLIQEGNIGLMMAVKKFDPDRGIRLISYAVWWIRAYIQNYIVKTWSLVKIGTTQAQKKLFFKLKQTQAALLRLTGREDGEEIAQTLDVRTDEVEEMSRRLAARETSLDVELIEGEHFTLMDTLVDDTPDQESRLIEDEHRRRLSSEVHQAFDCLNDRERKIIQERILDESPRTLQELADDFGISRERVRQLEANALSKLRGTLEGLRTA
ncbi:RNA polymerase sigma factor RpoH [Trichloromonas acetexigens]|jgi:RNA polymerase sigma-32 factor|uniref:RNA polymerase sigma factor n=1 Tax=Trichloromonas acetexigens TaxID=38815 RepID=A0A550JB86_9BACT|nr:RNA polymerase sigma factor RpoH [Desulfuromonas acetexigens]TRO80332.1 RNA polymerase sigma factor RpoH [Desulfuromonas acetexigens]